VNFNPGIQSISAPGMGQSYTATVDGHISQIDIKSVLPLSNARINIYNGSNGSGIPANPGSPDYTQNGINLVTNNPMDPNDWTSISLSTPFPVTSGSTYSFIIENQVPVDAVQLYVENSNNYIGGHLFVQYALVQSGYDLNFRIWETSTPPPPGPTPTPIKAWPAAIALLALVAIKLFRN